METGGSNGNLDGIAVFSGGTAANSLVDVFQKIISRNDCPLRYIIPISDNGGSSSELIRVFGGPSVGDIRTLKALFEYRLPSDPFQARTEWLDIVEARHLLWTFVSSPKRELIRSVFNALNLEVMKRARPTSGFNFAKASVGNLFLTGARLFSGSFEAAIYLLSMICSMPESISVLPAINSNFTHHIAAVLADGTELVGQVAISHPSAPTSVPDQALAPEEDKAAYHDRVEDDALPGSLPVLRQRALTFSKDEEDDLPSRIQRIWYINPYGHEIWPLANPKVLDAIKASRTVVYSIGSLYTSIIPSIVPRGVGAAIASPKVRNKVLILNARIDRETGPSSSPMTAGDFIAAIARAAKESQSDFSPVGDDELRKYVTHLLYLEGAGAPRVDAEGLRRLGITAVRIAGKMVGEGEKRMMGYSEEGLTAALQAVIAG